MIIKKIKSYIPEEHHFKIKWSVIAAVLFTLLVFVFEIQHQDRYFPGVIIAGESVGGKTYEEVSNKFAGKIDSLTSDGLSLVMTNIKGDKKEIKIPRTTPGLTSDVSVEYFFVGDWEESLRFAYNFGRDGSFFQKFKNQLSLLLRNKNFNLPLSLHNEAVSSLLSREAKNFFKQKVPAQFAMSGKKVVISKELTGDSIDLKGVVDTVSENLKTLKLEQIVFKSEPETSFATEARLKPFIGLAEALAGSAKVNFHYKTRRWIVDGRTLITWLTLRSYGDFGIDNTKLEAFLSKTVVPLINDPPQNSRFQMQDGELVEILPGKAGNIVSIDKVIERVEKIIPSIRRPFISTGDIVAAMSIAASEINYDVQNSVIDVPIETVRVEPEITKETVEKYNIKDLVGVARTSFKGSGPDRVHNIKMGVSKLTGILIAPDQTFSTVAALGPVSEETGFLKEYVIKGDRNVKELGGGLCQLATTLFRTFLDTGLPITERAPHAYVVKYYGPGLDATIYGPHPDLRFKNDTGNYLLLQGRVSGTDVIFEMYGVDDGRKAEISEAKLSNPKPVPPTRYVITDDVAPGVTQCASTTHTGITADVLYTVTYLDGKVATKNFHSVYVPWPKVCLVGSASLIPAL